MADLLIHVSRRAMACEFEVQFPAERYPQGTQAAQRCSIVSRRWKSSYRTFGLRVKKAE